MDTPIRDRILRSRNIANSLATPTRCNYRGSTRGVLCAIGDPDNTGSLPNHQISIAKEVKPLTCKSVDNKENDPEKGDTAILHEENINLTTKQKQPVNNYCRWLAKTAYPYKLSRSLMRREMFSLPYADLAHRFTRIANAYANDFVSSVDHAAVFLDEQSNNMLPLYAAYSHNARNGKLLAVSDESGHITLLDTRYTLRESESRVKQWDAHKNSIFNFQWSWDDTCIATGAGDQLVKLWDVETNRLLGIFDGHKGTVKSVVFHPTEPSIFATSGRDGNVLLWDMRCMAVASDDEFCHHRPANRIANANARVSEVAGGRKRRRTLTDLHKSVSSVVFLKHHDHLLASAGASDGLIKYWDVRHHGSYSNRDIPTPVSKSEYSGVAKRPHGISSLVLDNSGTRLFATCTDNTIYEYDARTLGRSRATYTSDDYRCSNFYVGTAVSPDNRFLISGSTNEYAYIWEMDTPSKRQEPIKLRGHTGEVSRVNWSHRNPHELVSCSDDGTIRVWYVDQEQARECRSSETLREQYGTAVRT